jgi:hypothetical protein
MGQNPIASPVARSFEVVHFTNAGGFDERQDVSHSARKTIWIFSDMMNETKGFRMPELIELGPQGMLDRAKVNGLVVPLNGYIVYIYGASMHGLTPHAWMNVRDFWTRYFSAAGAELISYSGECDLGR